ncbi:hypothetical protein C8J35_106115 [Rhizobium sp. PP-F2F-G38]|nr:hypothetical protein [Ferranicluibacter rubi]PYE34081.1 hypothetical protein C8J37_104174 [Rhizobium sp. PP-WC-1G-195]PYE96717.1 hypothetical protein C8J35_106115 [Rhizobium sp. PP-F2F-G38]TCP86129.1 hypothetical protein C8J31_10699 [Rhizobium sp. PP-CC-2G-626]TCQ06015.1 hypothetical protein C8J34_10698 [Rhizobium sp. PP-F2F-G36]TCQ23598.1 hypothetical protein C8J33_104178 [Rhizobium sp. PP-CC-3G-465]
MSGPSVLVFVFDIGWTRGVSRMSYLYERTTPVGKAGTVCEEL